MTRYGLINRKQLDEMAYQVCECLGHGVGRYAQNLLIETCGAETHHGRTKDLTKGAGMGIMQIDKLPFHDIKDRVRESDKIKILDYFDIDIDLVAWEHLRYNPLLSLIFARLKYKKIVEVIPDTLEARAMYWKKYYNTIAGKGTLDHYVFSNLKAEHE